MAARLRIFVTGATGYVGGAVARALAAAGHEVSGLARSPAAAEKLARAGLRAIPGGLEDPAGLERAAAEHDASVHAAAAGGHDRPAADRAAALALIAGAKRSGAPRVVVYTSGVWTLGATGAAPAGEDAPVDHPAQVSAHRPALERELLDRAGGELVTAVVRPGMLYGGPSGIAATLGDFLPRAAGFERAIVFLGDGASRWSPIHHDDVGALYRLVIEKRAAGIFHAVEESAVSVADAARALARAARLDARSFALDAARAKLGPLADAFALDIAASAPRARALGWRPRHAPFADSIDSTWSEFKGE